MIHNGIDDNKEKNFSIQMVAIDETFSRIGRDKVALDVKVFSSAAVFALALGAGFSLFPGIWYVQ